MSVRRPDIAGFRKAPRLLVVGGAGYIGSAVVFRALTETNMVVTVVDRLLYGGSALFRMFSFGDRFHFIGRDVRDLDLDELVRGQDFVVNVAALVGEHICKKFPEDAVAINQDVTIALGKACARNGVRRYLFASTCSNYGKTDVFVDETAPVNPLSLYATTKINVENFLMDECDCPCAVLRFATIFGLSSRVRFDLLIHEFIRDAWTNKEIEIYGPDGWRPFCHVDDAARAVLTVLAQTDTVGRKVIFNVGSNDHNFQKRAIGEMVAARLEGTNLKLRYDKGDPRSYKVNFGKIQEVTGFRCRYNAKDAIDQICTALENGLITTTELEESVNISKDDPIRKVATGSAIKYAPVKKKQQKSKL